MSINSQHKFMEKTISISVYGYAKRQRFKIGHIRSYWREYDGVYMSLANRDKPLKVCETIGDISDLIRKAQWDQKAN